MFDLSAQLPNLYKSKQEYTDVCILGLTNFNQKDISEINKKIINLFLNQIVKYRTDNNLPEINFQNLSDNKYFIEKKAEICHYFSKCKLNFK